MWRLKAFTQSLPLPVSGLLLSNLSCDLGFGVSKMESRRKAAGTIKLETGVREGAKELEAKLPQTGSPALFKISAHTVVT